MDEDYSMEQAQMRQRITGLERLLEERQKESGQLRRKVLQDGLRKERTSALTSSVVCLLCMPLLWCILPFYGIPLWMLLFTLVMLAAAIVVECLAVCRLAAMDVLTMELEKVKEKMVHGRRFMSRWYLLVVFPFLIVWLSCFLFLVKGYPFPLMGACIGGLIGIISGWLFFRSAMKRMDGFIREIEGINEKELNKG